jgi:hypothetical protein
VTKTSGTRQDDDRFVTDYPAVTGYRGGVQIGVAAHGI